jgi:hypothetical protein
MSTTTETKTLSTVDLERLRYEPTSEEPYPHRILMAQLYKGLPVAIPTLIMSTPTLQTPEAARALFDLMAECLAGLGYQLKSGQ